MPHHQEIVIRAGDQRLNSIHFLPLLSQGEARKKLIDVLGEDTVNGHAVRTEAFVHTDIFGKANACDKENLVRSGESFALINNNCEALSWMAAYQVDTLWRDDTPRHIAQRYAYTDAAVDTIVHTRHSKGLIPHPRSDRYSTDRLQLGALPEIYEEGAGDYGLKLLRSYFRKIMQNSGANYAEKRQRVNHIMRLIEEYRALQGDNSTHAGLINHILANILPDNAAERLTNTFDEFRLDAAVKNKNLHSILDRWIQDDTAERNRYNEALGHHAEKHLLAEGELPYWVSLPEQLASGKTLHRRYPLYKRGGKYEIEKEGATLVIGIEQDIHSAAKLAHSIERHMAHLADAHEIALIPKSHVLLGQLSTGLNVLVQPLKNAAYGKEADAYAATVTDTQNKLFLKVDVWEILKDEPLRVPQEIALLLGDKKATGEKIQVLQSELHTPAVHDFITHILPLMVLRSRLEHDARAFPRGFASLVTNHQILSPEEFFLSNKGNIAVIPAAQTAAKARLDTHLATTLPSMSTFHQPVDCIAAFAAIVPPENHILCAFAQRSLETVQHMRAAITQAEHAIKQQCADAQPTIVAKVAERDALAQQMKEKKDPALGRHIGELNKQITHLQKPPELEAQRVHLQNRLQAYVQHFATALAKGPRQIQYAPYYIDPVQLYIGWGQGAIARSAASLHLSPEEFI